MVVEIVRSEKKKIVLAVSKPRFLHLKFSRSYLRTNAFNLALLSELAYRTEAEILTALFRNSFDEQRKRFSTEAENVQSPFIHTACTKLEAIETSFSFLEKEETDTQIFHFDQGDCIVASFRGTAGMTDIMTDLKSSLVDFPEGSGRVHEGFLVAFRSIRGRLDELAEQAKGRPFILTGHSLGGALATLAAAYLKKKSGGDIMLYTFGSPLVGDSDFAKQYSNGAGFHYFRVVNNEDIITMIPPPYTNLRIGLVKMAISNPFFLIPATLDPFGKPFTHIGRIIFIRRISMGAVSVDIDRKQPYYIKVPEKLVGSEDRPKWEKLIDWAPFCASDHSMKRYVSILASDLRLAIGNYLESARLGQESVLRTIAYLESEISDLENRKNALEKDLLSTPYPIYPDATGSTVARAGQQTPTERLQKVSEALQTKQLELMHQKTRLAAMSSPGYPEAVLKETVGIPASPSLEREFEYQQKSIKY